MTNSERKKRQETDKSKYTHQSTGDACTCAAYVAEIMCMRNAQHKNVGSLPFKFWNTKAWNWTFKKQVVLANKLLTTYSETALLRAITQIKTLFSLNNKRLLPVLKRCEKQFQEERAEQKKRVQEMEKPAPVEQKHGGHRKTSYGKKSTMNKLRGMKTDGKKEIE